MKRILIYCMILLCLSGSLSAHKASKRLSDDELMTLVQKQTFRYFWDYAHPTSGLARERSNGDDQVVTIGGSGFGVMAIIVGVERGFVTRQQGAERMLKIVNFLFDKDTDSYHGMWAHWMNGETGKTIPFSRKDDGADVVESAFMFEGLLAAHQYFNQNNPVENRIRQIISTLWRQAEWNFFTRGQDVLFWHWSPNNGWAMSHRIKGHNECHIAYILGASSPTYPIAESVYHNGWANANTFLNGREYYGIKLPLGNNNGLGGPLFFTHYSYMGLDPNGLKDRYADYGQQMKAHAMINHAYCVENPKGFKGYGDNCWGLTASDGNKGYSAHSPGNDRGVIAPTAALSSIPYTPELSLKAMRHFYEELGNPLWGEYGFKDAFNLTDNWFAPSYLAIDQGPIVVMIENYRSGLIWKLFMSHPDIQNGLKRLGFSSPYLSSGNLDVMSFNIRLDHVADGPNNWKYRKDNAAQMIAYYQPDIIGMQEVVKNQRDDLLHRLPQYSTIGVGRADGRQKGEYCPVFYKTDRFDLLKSGNFGLSENPDSIGKKGWDAACERIVTWAVLKDKTSGKSVAVFNTHLDHIGEEARRQSASLIIEKINLLAPGIPVIMTGDFNGTDDSEPIRIIKERGMKNARTESRLTYGPAWSFHDYGRIPENERKMIDFIFTRGLMNPERFRVIDDRPDNGFLSDHAPIMASFII